MIKNFGDHSANERTFLAWVRTAIGIMAFGFLVEKFDLFLELAAPSLAGRTISIPGQRFGNVAGLSLIPRYRDGRVGSTALLEHSEEHRQPGDSAEDGVASGCYPCGSFGVVGLRSLFLSRADYRVEHAGSLTSGGSSDGAVQWSKC
jgi:Domain of unknown function (DUF202)